MIQWGNEKIVINQAEQPYLVYGFESDGKHIAPPHYQPKRFSGDSIVWILPVGNGAAFQIKLNGTYKVRHKKKLSCIELTAPYTKAEHPARPACDFFGNAVKFNFANGEEFEKAYAHFYWGNLLQQVAERTLMRKKKDIREGYVLSTLNKKAYAGTYPAVDHEFHMKGRIAVGGEAEIALVKRMLELQLKIMREDKRHVSRNVCAVQPNRRREYNVWRRSQDRTQKAQMFRITANIEFVEGVYQYYCATKDLAFLQKNIAAIENSCAYIERFIEPDGLLNSHVYFEDQVIKNGKVNQAQCFAVNAFRLMAQLENKLGRGEQAQHYSSLAAKLGNAVGRAYPQGYWDENSRRFIDWIDVDGNAHDHVHLLANELPVLFGMASAKQAELARQTLHEHSAVFNKFPSFVAAKIEDYTSAEIGSGGPYDLCAAGRYWCWDAAYKAFESDGAALHSQLMQVLREAQLGNYLMGERYDMNYVFYNTGTHAQHNWHGASLYYEYPNVFLHVLVQQYLGVSFGFDCDLIVAPLVQGEASVTLENYGIAYTTGKRFSVTNISSRVLSISLPLLKTQITLAPEETYRET